jgi:hypothetical protein
MGEDMKVKFTDLQKLKDWDYLEVMDSPEFLHFTDIVEKDECEIKLLIDGVEYEPVRLKAIYDTLFELVESIEKHIEEDAIELIARKLKEVTDKKDKLNEMIDDFTESLKDLAEGLI